MYMTARNVEKRSEIISATRLLLKRNEPATIRMVDIATAVGRARSTLYKHFRSRDDILIRIYIQALRQQYVCQLAVSIEGRNGLQRIRCWGLGFLRFARWNPHCLRLQIHMESRIIDPNKLTPPTRATADKAKQRVHAPLIDAYHLGLRDGSLRRSLDIESNHAALVGGLRSMLTPPVVPCERDLRYDPSLLGREFLMTFTRGLARR